jgi:hypothetical protein
MTYRTFTFTGHVVESDVATNTEPRILQGVGNGSTFTGHFTVDLSLAPSNAWEKFADYPQYNDPGTGVIIQLNGTGGQSYTFATKNIPTSNSNNPNFDVNNVCR